MRNICCLLTALLLGLSIDAGPARAQMGFGFGGGGMGFGGGGRGFGGGGFGRDGGFGRQGGGLGREGGGLGRQGGFGREGGLGRAGQGGFARGANGQRGGLTQREPGTRGGRAGLGERATRQPPGTGRVPPRRVVVNPPRPRPPGAHPRPPIIIGGPRRPIPPIVVVAPPPVVVPPTADAPQPRRLTGAPPVLPPTPPRDNAGTPPPPATPVADANFNVPNPDERRYVPNETIVTTRGDLSPARLQLFERRLGLTPLASSRIKLLDLDVRRYRIGDNASVRGTIQALQGNPDVRSAQPNYLFELQDDGAPKAIEPKVLTTKTEGAATPEKPAAIVETTRPQQYAIDAMKLEGAHKLANGDAVLVAIIDTGLDETHPEIAGMVADRYDAVGGAYRAHSHGTAMAGVIVAHKDLVGIAPKARLLAIRAFDNVTSGSGQGTTYDILRGLDFAADHKARIINMSFAGPRDALLSEALAKARSLGMIEIAAAGNAGPESAPLYPAAEPGVIAITATDAHNKLFALANRGAYVAAAAPGVDIVAPGVGGAVQLSSGTSIAAAEASGVVALLLQGKPGLSADEARKVLGETALHGTGETAQVIDALAAVQALGANPPPQSKGGGPPQAVEGAAAATTPPN